MLVSKKMMHCTLKAKHKKHVWKIKIYWLVVKA